MSEFSVNIESTLDHFQTRKDVVLRFIKKHFQENVHYITKKNNNQISIKGGRSKIDCFITENAYELLKKSYNLKHRYNPFLQERTIMSIENQTIAFITSCFSNIHECDKKE